FFPGYANSLGAIGYFYLDTTAFENGVHTIQWAVTDSGGNSDGIGSRYFTIQNTGASSSSLSHATGIQYMKPLYDNLSQLEHLPGAEFQPLPLNRGAGNDIQPEQVKGIETGMFTVKTGETERIAVEFPKDIRLIEGYSIIGQQLRPLPIGSTLDTGTGTFYWLPGPGFVGSYRLVFISVDNEGRTCKNHVAVQIEPKS
ncbi:MAG: hypothetical protein GY940_10110, partial [bacterium]|nr:hypothetical protein [bacterium]